MSEPIDDGPPKLSPYISLYMARTQVERLIKLLEAQPQKYWQPTLKYLLKKARVESPILDSCGRTTGVD